MVGGSPLGCLVPVFLRSLIELVWHPKHPSLRVRVMYWWYRVFFYQASMIATSIVTSPYGNVVHYTLTDGYGWRDVRGSISETRLARFKFGCDLKHCTPPSHINKGSNHDENSVIQVPSHNIGLECLEICWEWIKNLFYVRNCSFSRWCSNKPALKNIT